MDEDTNQESSSEVDAAIGRAIRQLRETSGMTAKALAEKSLVSAAMISRIENGLASASLSSLHALAKALDVPLVALFGETTSRQCDFTHLRAGQGIPSARMADGHLHEFVQLAVHNRVDLLFSAVQVTLTRQDMSPPSYTGRGVVFLRVLSGEAIYRYGKIEMTLVEGDTLSIDSELPHGFVRLLTPKFEYLSVQAESR